MTPDTTVLSAEVLGTLAPAIVGAINQLLPVGVAILTPVIALRLIPRIVYMFL
jgi:hypothetical protein